MNDRLAGERRRSRARSTGALVILVDAYEQGLGRAEDGDGRWATICDTHSTLVHHDTLALARNWMPAPEGWCDECREVSS